MDKNIDGFRTLELFKRNDLIINILDENKRPFLREDYILRIGVAEKNYSANAWIDIKGKCFDCQRYAATEENKRRLIFRLNRENPFMIIYAFDENNNPIINPNYVLLVRLSKRNSPSAHIEFSGEKYRFVKYNLLNSVMGGYSNPKIKEKLNLPPDDAIEIKRIVDNMLGKNLEDRV